MQEWHRQDATVGVATGAHATLVKVMLCHCRSLQPAVFKAQVERAHQALHDAVMASPHSHIIRLWNFIPGIHDAMDDGCDRYMTFNAGRFTAMRGWFGSDADLRANVPAASGVGHDGAELAIYALAMAEPGLAVDNPQQTPALRYSKTYGPVPPCFARATRVQAPRPALFIAGTAAIRGERTEFENDLGRQWALTLDNLRTVIASGWSGAPKDPLHALATVRVYVPDPATQEVMHAYARESFAASTEVEWVRADLCRRDLLVEIEGVVE